jgi:subtilisin family serine protease
MEKIEKSLKQQNQEKNSPSDDTFSHLQYYLQILGIPDAWKKITEPKKVIVAVIDDGVNVNHPDLTDHIWSEPGIAYGSSKIKDFVGDKLPDNLPTGQHGTMIAGIIGAATNNKKGIAGIAKNVEIMPLRVFDFKGNAREESIINAMYYAINNNVNIINLSLGQSQFNYSTRYDEVMKKAYENGVIVFIAAGNGDVLAFSNNGINTTVNPISPVCNNSGSKKYSFGVEALDQK